MVPPALIVAGARKSIPWPGSPTGPGYTSAGTAKNSSPSPYEFLQAAKDAANNAAREDKALEDEENKICARLNEIKKRRDDLADAPTRLTAYPPSGAKIPCPFCFVANGLAVEMKDIPSSGESDEFECGQCNLLIACEE